MHHGHTFSVLRSSVHGGGVLRLEGRCTAVLESSGAERREPDNPHDQFCVAVFVPRPGAGGPRMLGHIARAAARWLCGSLCTTG